VKHHVVGYLIYTHPMNASIPNPVKVKNVVKRRTKEYNLFSKQ
jgi:hypothetical protein